VERNTVMGRDLSCQSPVASYLAATRTGNWELGTGNWKLETGN
jgi:hypothetical protein